MSYCQNSSVSYAGNVALASRLGITRAVNSNAIELTTTHGGTFDNGFFIGVGSGLSYDLSKMITMPVFVEGRYNFVEGDISPLLACRLGGNFILDDYRSNRRGGGLTVSPAAGVDFGRFSLQVFYQYDIGRTSDSGYSCGDYKLHYMGISFMLNLRRTLR